jgi:hypothetical protein
MDEAFHWVETGRHIHHPTGATAPGALAANYIGQIYTDTTAHDSYIAVQLGSGSDWKKTTP